MIDSVYYRAVCVGRVAPYSAVDPEEYFTISRQGVTHVLNKEADFVPLPEWERDYLMFQKLAKVPRDQQGNWLDTCLIMTFLKLRISRKYLSC